MTETTAAVEDEAPIESKKELATKAFLAAIDAGKSRPEIIEEMKEASGASQAYANTLFPILCQIHDKKPAPTVLDDRGSKSALFEVFDIAFKNVLESDDPQPDDVAAARDAAIEAAEKAVDVSKTTIQNHLRTYMADNDLESPRGARGNIQEKTVFVGDMLKDGAARKDIIKALQEKYDQTPAGAAATYQNILKKNNWESTGGGAGRDSAKRDEAWDWFKGNMNAKREEALAAFIEMDVSPSMAQQYWGTFSLAVELAKDLAGENSPPAAQAAAA